MVSEFILVPEGLGFWQLATWGGVEGQRFVAHRLQGCKLRPVPAKGCQPAVDDSVVLQLVARKLLLSHFKNFTYISKLRC